jgi:hypothetical protein
LNNIYMIQANPAGLGGGTGTLALYDFAHQFQETAGRLFGRDVQFTWNASTKKINFHRKFTGPEELGLHVYLAQPDDVSARRPLCSPVDSGLRLAQAKFMLGEAYSKFGRLLARRAASAQGRCHEDRSHREMERLDTEFKNTVDGHMATVSSSARLAFRGPLNRNGYTLLSTLRKLLAHEQDSRYRRSRRTRGRLHKQRPLLHRPEWHRVPAADLLISSSRTSIMLSTTTITVATFPTSIYHSYAPHVVYHSGCAELPQLLAPELFPPELFQPVVLRSPSLK